MGGDFEANFDGLVGPTHSYAGLSHGNVASERNMGLRSRPREAALQGLAKMRSMVDLGLVQGVLPPHERPALGLLRELGFTGSDADVVSAVAKADPVLLGGAYSASAMWAANAATVAPSADTADGRVHFTPANLNQTLHRSIEAAHTARTLRRVFPDPARFVHHAPLPGGQAMADEGAANHTRLHAGGDGPGVHFFVYGRSASGRPTPQPPPKLYPARQTLEASEAVARLHQLDPARTVFAQQNPAVIDEGVFHNDVIAVGHEQVLLYHERAFAEGERAVQHLSQALGGRLIPVRIDADELSVSDAVGSYLFNAMLVTAGAGRLALIAPLEAQECAPANDAIQRIISEDGNPIAEVHFLDVRQSMANGGGPACLRLRVRLTEAERAAAHGPCLLDAAKIQGLERWVRTHYREVLRPEDLRDPVLVTEVRTALDALTELLALGSDFYPFQRTGG